MNGSRSSLAAPAADVPLNPARATPAAVAPSRYGGGAATAPHSAAAPYRLR